MMEKGIIILQWNCRGIYHKFHEFKIYLSGLDAMPDCIVLQESHLIERYSPKIHGYTLFRKDKSASSGGLAMFVKESLQTSEIDIVVSSNIEIQCIRVNYLHIYNIYIAPNCPIRDSDLTFLDNLPGRTIVMGDFNSHHLARSTYENPINNQRGRLLFDSLDRNKLALLNSTSPTRINLSTNAVNRWSLLDLTIASIDIASKCQTHVTDQLIGSDHYIIITTLNSTVTYSEPMPIKWSLSKANWKEFSHLVDAGMQDIDILPDADTGMN